jgi:hypothetical protein
MADQIYVSRNTVFAATPGAKTVLKIITPTTFNIEIVEMALFTDGVTASAVPATWDMFISDETTAGTQVGTSVTTQVRGAPLAHGCTVGQNFSAEGTVYTIIKSGFVPQFMGQLVLPNPLGLGEMSPAGTADSIGLRINVTANVNVLSWLKWTRA